MFAGRNLETVPVNHNTDTAVAPAVLQSKVDGPKIAEQGPKSQDEKKSTLQGKSTRA